MLFVRDAVAESLRDDHVLAARARGLPGRTVLFGHALRTALLPFLTLVGTHLPELVGGAVLVETVFSLPGLGAVTVQAALGSDFPLLAATTLATTVVVLAANLATDLGYAAADPGYASMTDLAPARLATPAVAAGRRPCCGAAVPAWRWPPVLAVAVAACLLAPLLWPLDQSAVDLARTRLAPSLGHTWPAPTTSAVTWRCAASTGCGSHCSSARSPPWSPPSSAASWAPSPAPSAGGSTGP